MAVFLIYVQMLMGSVYTEILYVMAQRNFQLVNALVDTDS